MKKFTKVIAAIMLMTAAVFTAGCKPEDSNNEGGNGTYNGHEYVDLGLPSGTLWATCNVGANIPEKFGGYFAWGETMPKTYYDLSKYKYYNNNNETLTKYCNEGSYSDNLTTLRPTDDAATANWGNGWCMPIADQWRELLQNTEQHWTTQNGVNGLHFIANNGNSLFLPAAGYRHGLELSWVGSDVAYWSSSLSTDNQDYAWSNSGTYDFSSFGTESLDYAWDFGLGSVGECLNPNPRWVGFSVRPVRSTR